jgi:hypothetical protein
MSNFVICPCCGQWLEIQDIGFYTYAFPMSLNARDVVMNMNTQDFLNSLQTNIEDFKFNSEATQCILNKENL